METNNAGGSPLKYEPNVKLKLDKEGLTIVETTREFGLHTILVLVGPSCSGKSTFAKKVQEDLKGSINTVILSSDQIRRELINNPEADYASNSEDMMQVSKQAFELLMTKLKLHTTWPVKTELVIVDSTGLNEDFRKSLLKLASEQQYAIELAIFQFKTWDDHLSHIRNDMSTKSITRQLKKMNTEVLPKIGRNLYNRIISIKKWSDIDIKNIPRAHQMELRDRCVDKSGQEYFAIGDIHASLNTFKDLLVKAGFEISAEDVVSCQYNRKIILLNDAVDKGQNSAVTLRFIMKNKHIMEWVCDNHTKYVYDIVVLGKEYDTPKEFEAVYFNSIEEFRSSEENKEALKQFWEESIPFKRTKSAVYTHAPCLPKFLEKFDTNSLKAMRNWRGELEEILPLADRSYPYHVFGHRTFRDVVQYRNLLGIDTGGVHPNGKLTGVFLFNKGPFFHAVPHNQLDASFDHPIEHYKVGDKADFDMSELAFKDRARLHWLGKNKVNFISGTIAPAGTFEDNFESVKSAINYFKEKGVEEIIAQTKHMGSRCNAYLFRNPTEEHAHYATSRAGYVMKDLHTEKGTISISEALNDLRNSDNIQKLFDRLDCDLILLDGELMPWYAMGKGLIKNTFATMSEAISGELEFLEESNFEEAYRDLVKTASEIDRKEFNTTDHKAIRKSWGDAKYSTIKAFFRYKHKNVEELKKGFETFSEQVEIYGKSGNPYILPFALLKTVKFGQEDIVHATSDVPELFDFTSTMKIRLDDPLIVEHVQGYFDRKTEKGDVEGIMIKPVVQKGGLAPAIKVRNYNYLHIIYGYDFLVKEKFEKLHKRKRVNSKTTVSMKEWNTGLDMLKFNWEDLNSDNKAFAFTASKMIDLEKSEETLDPRL